MVNRSLQLNILSLDPFRVAACGMVDLLWLLIVTSDIDVRSCRDDEGGDFFRKCEKFTHQ